jgi:hypothetical protein
MAESEHSLVDRDQHSAFPAGADQRSGKADLAELAVSDDPVLPFSERAYRRGRISTTHSRSTPACITFGLYIRTNVMRGRVWVGEV